MLDAVQSPSTCSFPLFLALDLSSSLQPPPPTSLSFQSPPSLTLLPQNPEMLLHLKANVRRTMAHALEVEEKIPLEQVSREERERWEERENICVRVCR